MPAASRENRILHGPLAWEVARFGVPLAIGMALQTTFNLVDAFLIAQLPASEVSAAVGAIGICDQIAALGTIVSFGVSTAAAALVSTRAGAGEHAGVQRAAWQSLLVIAALSVVLGLLGVLGAGSLVRDVVGAKGAVSEVATQFLRVTLGGSFSIFFLLQLTTLQRALGSSKTPVGLLVAGNVLNLVLAVLLIFGSGPAPSWLGWSTVLARTLGIPRLGMVGAAWASILARSAVLIPNVLILARRFAVFPPRGERGPDLVEIRKLLAIAWPSCGQFVLRIGAMLLVNSLVARFFTTERDQTATTAMGLVFRLDTMALFVAMGWGNAAQTFVGQNLGAGAPRRATRAGWLAALYDVVTSVALCAAMFTWGEAILRIFDDEPGPIAIANGYLQIVAPSYLALGFAVVLGNAMAGAGATRTTLWLDAFVLLVFQLPLSLVLVSVLDGSLTSLFRAVAATNVVAAVAYALTYARGGWRNAVLAGPRPPRP